MSDAETPKPSSRAERDAQAFKNLMRAGLALVVASVGLVVLMWTLFPPKDYKLGAALDALTVVGI